MTHGRRLLPVLFLGLAFSTLIFEGRTYADANNLIANGGFETVDLLKAPSDWTAQGKAGLSLVSDQGAREGKYCAFLQRANEGSSDDNWKNVMLATYVDGSPGRDLHLASWRQNDIRLDPGELYRLSFWVKVDPMAQGMAAVSLFCRGEEGPAWPLKPIMIDEPMKWQHVTMLVRAQVGFNPISEIDLEFQLYQWRPGQPGDKTPQRLWIDDVVLRPAQPLEAAEAGIVRWLMVPNAPNIRYGDLEYGLGDGIAAKERTIELYRDGRKLSRVASIRQITGPDDFAFSARSRRVYMSKEGARGKVKLKFQAEVRDGPSGFLNLTPPDAGRALAAGLPGIHSVPLTIKEPGEIDRTNWPVRQGVPFPRGAVADVKNIRVLDPAGRETPSQARAVSYWEDDSIRWALLDFNADVKANQPVTYVMEYGAAVKNKTVANPIRLSETDDNISVDTGPMQFNVSKKRFRLFEQVQVDGKIVLSGSPSVKVIEDTGEEFTTDALAPYAVGVEEAGPMHSVIVVRGWHGNDLGDRFLTYTTRIHVYRGQSFVRVFHTLTNRHEENDRVKHKIAPEGWPKDQSEYEWREYPQRSIADASVFLPLDGVSSWKIGTELEGALDDKAITHRQWQRMSSDLSVGDKTRETGEMAGICSVASKGASLTAAVYNYAKLFPKELRVTSEGLEVGLIPCSKKEPHGLLKGTARTTELMFAFDGKGPERAQAFMEPIVLTNPDWYCASKGFINDELLPVNPRTIDTYDRIVYSFVEEIKPPYGPGVDDCGMMNYGDFTYGAYNRWVNLEYDSDLGLYIHFARAGDRFAFLFGQDASRHFMDSDMGWYTGDRESHGANFPHEYLHYAPHGPSGHTYSVGLMHNYLITGDRRALEATRLNAEACFRKLYYYVKVWGSLYEKDMTVAVPRRQFANDRHRSDPSRYPLHAYQVTGEPRFLETTLSVAQALVDMPRQWLGHDDMFLHYRWALVLDDLYQTTGQEEFKQILVQCAEWTMTDPYTYYGEFRASQCYGGRPESDNNTRMMFQTIYAYALTGNRDYLDWTMNMYDEAIETFNKAVPTGIGGKGFGKFGDNPARILPLIIPHRKVRLAVSPFRFEMTGPSKSQWRITIGNTSETSVSGTLKIGPLPIGVRMDTVRNFELGLMKETIMDIPVEFTDAAPNGRSIVPYSVYTTGGDGKGERHGFFAVHVLRPPAKETPKLLFHATLDDGGPAAVATGDGTAIAESSIFAPGKFGKAMTAETRAMTFPSKGNIRAETGTLSVWLRAPAEYGNAALVRIWGHGYWFVGIGTTYLAFEGEKFDYDFSRKTTDQWHHVAVTWDLKEAVFFVDGKQIGRMKRPRLDPVCRDIQLTPMRRFDIDDLRIYSAPLSESAIEDLCKDLLFGDPNIVSE